MLKIDSKKIWELLKKDKKIQKELAKYIKEEQDALDRAKDVYDKQLKVVEELKEKRENLSHKIDHIDQEITNQNAEISFLEIKKMMIERRLKRLERLIASASSEKTKRKFQKRAKKLVEEIILIDEKQLKFKDTIQDLEKEKENVLYEKRNTTEEINHNFDILEENAQSISFYQEELNTKENRFYKATYEEVTEYFKPCQDLVVPDLEESKKMSKENAKRKANPIIIDEENILSSPDQIKVRRLTKEEKEQYRKSA